MKKSQLPLKSRKTLRTLSTIRGINDVSKLLIKLIEIFSFLLCKSSGMRYGDNFIQMIKVAFTKSQSKIKTDSFLSDPFPLIRGVHLWCPLSMLLYIIAAEVFANFTYKD